MAIRKATPAELAAEGYKASSRRFFDEEKGHTISRYQGSIKPRLQQLGYDDAHDRADLRKRFRGVSEQDEVLWNKARKEGFSKKKDGYLSRFLVSYGIRDASAEYDVGETPK